MAEVGRIEGLGECLANMNLYGRELEAATPASLKRAALFLQRESQKEVPVGVTGNLKGSSFTRPAGRKEVHIGYTAFYAIFVHEMMNLNHNVGNAKYLTGPMEDNADDIKAIVANDLSKVRPRTT